MIFYETLIQSSGPTRSHLARFARARFTLRAHENFRKKSVSQSTRNALKRMQIKILPLWPITRFARSAKPERRSAMKFQYNQSDLSSNTFTKFHQNPTHSYWDIGFNSRTDRQIDRQIDRESRGGTDNRIWGHRKTVTISELNQCIIHKMNFYTLHFWDE